MPPCFEPGANQGGSHPSRFPHPRLSPRPQLRSQRLSHQRSPTQSRKSMISTRDRGGCVPQARRSQRNRQSRQTRGCTAGLRRLPRWHRMRGRIRSLELRALHRMEEPDSGKARAPPYGDSGHRCRHHSKQGQRFVSFPQVQGSHKKMCIFSRLAKQLTPQQDASSDDVDGMRVRWSQSQS